MEILGEFLIVLWMLLPIIAVYIAIHNHKKVMEFKYFVISVEDRLRKIEYKKLEENSIRNVQH